MNRLNLGCGPVQPAGWLNLDSDPRWHAEITGSLEAHLGGRVALDTFDLIVANHVLLHVAWPELVPLLTQCKKALRSGGVLRVLVPDMSAAFDAYVRDDAAWFPISDEHEKSIGGKLSMYLTQAGAARSLFTCEWLIELCHRAGFPDASEVDPGQSMLPAEYEPCSLDSRIAESIIVEART